MKPYCFDTNILVRFLVGDESNLLTLLAKNQATVPTPVWIELVYVLEKVYCVNREDIVTGVESLLADARIIAEKNLLSALFSAYINNPQLSIVDCFLYVFSCENNLELITLDKKLAKIAHQTN